MPFLINHLLDRSHFSYSQTGGPPYNNTDFDKAFAESFLDFARFLDPNVKFEPTITPQWSTWSVDHTEMLFNTTEGVPIVQPVKTSAALLERCR